MSVVRYIRSIAGRSAETPQIAMEVCRVSRSIKEERIWEKQKDLQPQVGGRSRDRKRTKRGSVIVSSKLSILGALI